MPFRYATYSEAYLKAEKAEGVTYDPAISVATLRAIKGFAEQEPTIILPARMQMGGEACRARSSPERNPTRRSTGISQVESR